MENDPGNANGNMWRDMKSKVMSGTPRISSMYATHNTLTNGSLLRRPNANRMPNGSAPAMPITANHRFNIKPPIAWASTALIPGIQVAPGMMKSEINTTAMAE